MKKKTAVDVSLEKYGVAPTEHLVILGMVFLWILKVTAIVIVVQIGWLILSKL